MKPETEFDAYLVSQLDLAPLPDQGFTRAVTAQLKRHRRLRRWALTGAAAVASGVAAVAASVAPVPALAASAFRPQSIVAALLLAALCSFVWIGTESRRPAPR